MVSKFTKDTERLSTEDESKSTGSAASTGARSVASHLMHGSRSETKAASWLSKKNWSIEAHRIKIAHVEVDFLARSPGGMLHIIEVKSGGAWGVDVLSARQSARLARVAEVLAQSEPVGLIVLVVQGEVVTPIRL